MIDCSNAIFILTSNLGAGEVDFRTAESDELRKMAERFLRRELVNRISDVIGFHPLGSAQMAKILDQIIAEKSRLFETEKGLTVGTVQIWVHDRLNVPWMSAWFNRWWMPGLRIG